MRQIGGQRRREEGQAQIGPGGPRQRRGLAAALGVTALFNYLSNRVLHDAAYVPAGLAMSGVLIGLGRGADLTWDEIGLDRKRLRTGLLWGLGAVALIGGAVSLLAAVPTFRSLFEDQRVVGASTKEAVYQMLVRIPLGTAVFEEVAFRGVLLALLLRFTDPWKATAISSGLFGLWHILPTLDVLQTSPVIDATEASLGVRGAVGVAVAATAAAGFLFAWIRLRSGSLLAPVLAHTAVNSLSFLAAYVLVRTGSAL